MYIKIRLLFLGSLFCTICLSQTSDSTGLLLVKMVDETYRYQNTELTDKDSIVVDKFKQKIVHYKRNRDYLAMHKEIIQLIKKDKSTPFSIALAKLLIVDDPYILDFLFKNIDIEKGKPNANSTRTYVFTSNILFEAFSSSYGHKAIFVKHLLFSDFLDDCNIDNKIQLTNPWIFNSDEQMSIFEYASFIFLNDSLFSAGLNQVILDESRTDCSHANANKILSFTKKYGK